MSYLAFRQSVLALTLALCAARPGVAEDLRDQMAEMLTEAQAESSAKSIVLMITEGDETLIVTKGDANADTRFYLASAGKSLVAAAVLNAVEEGSLSLDAPLAELVSGLPIADLAASRTLRQLLNHTSGLPEYLYDDFAEAAIARPAHRWSVAEALAFADPNEDQPSGTFEYNNTNYVLLGHILEGLDGTLEASLSARVFQPAGMDNSSVGATPGPNLARGFDENGRDVSETLWNSTLADGPVMASAADMVRFAEALFEGDNILDDQTRSQMLREGGAGSGYGLGIGVDGDDWGTWYGHSGGFDGASTDYRHYPETGTTLVVLANGELDTDWTMDEAAAIWFEQD